MGQRWHCLPARSPWCPSCWFFIQAAGERGSFGGGWLITAQIASALALPFASDILARLPVVGAAVLFVIYCAAQAAVAHRLAPSEAPEREETRVAEVAETA